MVDIHYSRNVFEFKRGTFRVRGDVIEIHPAYDDFGLRVEMMGDIIEKISTMGSLLSSNASNMTKEETEKYRKFLHSELEKLNEKISKSGKKIKID